MKPASLVDVTYHKNNKMYAETQWSLELNNNKLDLNSFCYIWLQESPVYYMLGNKAINYIRINYG